MTKHTFFETLEFGNKGGDLEVVKHYMTAMPHTIGSDTTCERALSLMTEVHCHYLPVLDGGVLVGMVSEYSLTLLMEKGQLDKETKVEDVFFGVPFVVDPETPIREVAAGMLQRSVGNAIVSAKGDQPWGIFAVSDALKIIVELPNQT